MGFVLPSKSQVGYLDPEIAGEGTRVIMSDGSTVTYNAAPPKPVMPDLSGVKSIAHYFNRTDFSVWPAWLYHPKEAPRIVKNAHEAAELGVCYREATNEERGRYGLTHVWDWKDDCEWRPQPPASAAKFDPKNPGLGKIVVHQAPSQIAAQDALVERLVPLVAASVVSAMKGVSAPSGVNADQWEEFLKFQAWKQSAQATTQAVEVLKDEVEKAPEVKTEARNALSASPVDDKQVEKMAWIKRAGELDIEVDGRWSLEKIRGRVQQAEQEAA